MIIAGTGHRPDKLGGYGLPVKQKLYKIAFKWLEENRVNKVISGMALGWDQALLRAAIDLGFYTIAAIPFPSFYVKWPQQAQQEAIELLSLASEVKTVNKDPYSKIKMHLRNEWMVNHCDKVLALWDGSQGGTASTIRYAELKNKPIINLWSQYNG